jgi:hypothetical protein
MESRQRRGDFREWPLTLRVFGRLPVTGEGECTEAGVRKASKEETAGEFAPAVVSAMGI